MSEARALGACEARAMGELGLTRIFVRFRLRSFRNGLRARGRGRFRLRLARAEDVVDEACRRARAARRAAGLDQHRPPLRRGHAAERTFHLEERASMIDGAHLARILDDDAAVAIPAEGVRLDARP